jgi:hypothetical protein
MAAKRRKGRKKGPRLRQAFGATSFGGYWRFVPTVGLVSPPREGSAPPITNHLSPFASSARGFAFVFSLRSLRSFAACRAVGFAKEGLLNLPQRWDKAHLLELIKEPE